MPNSESNNDKRSKKRVIILELEVYRQSTGERFGKMINLSEGGMLVMREAPMKNEAVFSITIPLNREIGGQIEFKSDVKVAWYRQNEISGFHSIGCEFINLTPEQNELVKKMIDVFGSEEP